MRLWTLHPCYLDSRGLVALWREALLAQAVLGGHTRGYTYHPQLCRFRDTPSPMAAIATYLHAVHSEANVRGYRFNVTKILSERNAVHIAASRGQLDYEWKHLVEKLRSRDPTWLEQFATLTEPKPHPMFLIVSGPIAEWEVTRANPSSHRTLRDKAAQRR
ncbi:MAG: pyrimidine dimer DNA glycosylase/endonuclease V [Betaproteobacteria bacterium]|nr:pyrimidine dimer DNA glycosylase/endonuclease V [Betaproteobacteria bacterium]